MPDEPQKQEPVLDLRHIGRVLDKEMPVRSAGWEMSKPGSADMRRRRFTVKMPHSEPKPGPDNPPQNVR
ncbi:MAG TPA: hypothetical protein VEV38_13510 [Candidatus Eremiobacteraceae bacterium]|nr:hypothetical protein [Candidatus Eremiobacteraceae bacterium]